MDNWKAEYKEIWEYIKISPLYKYLSIEKYDWANHSDDEDNPKDIDSIDFVNDDFAEFNDKKLFRPFPTELKRELSLFYNYYHIMWRRYQSLEFMNNNSDSAEFSKVIREYYKKAGDKSLSALSLRFGNRDSESITITDENFLNHLDNWIDNYFKDHLIHFPLPKNSKVGKKSSYIREFGMKLYPFYLFLKEIYPYVPASGLNGLYQKIIEFLSLDDPNEYLTEEKMKDWFKANPNDKIIIKDMEI